MCNFDLNFDRFCFKSLLFFELLVSSDLFNTQIFASRMVVGFSKKSYTSEHQLQIQKGREKCQLIPLEKKLNGRKTALFTAADELMINY